MFQKAQDAKRCTACGAVKPLAMFYLKNRKGRRYSKCIECTWTVRKKPSNCRRCGRSYLGRLGRPGYCGPVCREAAMAERVDARLGSFTWACAQCGNAHRSERRAGVLAKRKYCSKKCEAVARTKPLSQRYRYIKKGRRTVPRRPQSCRGCGAMFSVRLTDMVPHKFCSLRCYRAHVGRRPMFIDAKCQACGMAFRRTAAAVKRSRRVFCSQQCSREMMKGENSPQYRGGHDPNRGPAWNALAEKIRVRDGYVCQRCNKTQSENRQKLSVDHIIPWRSFSDKAKANHPTNLVALCRRCHAIKTTRYEMLWLKGDRIGMEQYRKAIQLPPLFAAVDIEKGSSR